MVIKKLSFKREMKRLDLFFKIREFKANNEALPEILIEFIKTSEIIP